MKKLSELKISPEPWKLNDHATILDSNSVVISVQYGPYNWNNARLIAAAPKLYEAVYDLLEIVGNVSEYIGVDCDAMNNVEKARAALADAAGESEVSNG